MKEQATETPETNDEYHADTKHIGKSMVDVYRQSRRKYYERFVAKTMPPPEPTAQMRLGSLVHLAVLQRSVFDSTVAVAPKVDRRTKAGKAEWAEFVEQTDGKTVVSVDEYDKALRIAEAVLTNPVASRLLSYPGAIEEPYRWLDGQSGLRMKCRPDLARPDLLVDLKTCHAVDPESFAKSAVNLGYHRQHEWYQRGWQDKTGKSLPFVFVAVATSEPFDCAIYELNPQAVEIGANQNRSALQNLAASYRNDEWTSPEARQITTLSLPRWAVYFDEWEIMA